MDGKKVEVSASYHASIKRLFAAVGSPIDYHEGTDVAKRFTPIYAEYLSEEDIEGIIEGVQTPLGQKLLKALPEAGVKVFKEVMVRGFPLEADIYKTKVN